MAEDMTAIGAAATERTGNGLGSHRPTPKGGQDYGRFIEAVRDIQDHARAADAPDDVISEATDLLGQVSRLLAPYAADEWSSPSGRRDDLPLRGNVLIIPQLAELDEDGRIRGWARFRRFHLGRNGAAHGGSVAQFFDSALGKAAYLLTGGHQQRTAYLHVNYRNIVPIETELQVESWVDRVEGRKIFVAATLSLDGTLLADGEGLFVRLRPGQQ